jgi:hypothetical protein
MKLRNFTRALAALSITGAVALTAGCATIDSSEQSIGHAFGAKQDSTTTSGVVGGVLGCGAGVLLGHVLMHQSALGSCAVGGAVGAIGSIENHKHLLAEAQKVKDEANQVPGVTATVATKTVQATNAQGQQESTLTLDRLELNLPASKVAAHSDDVVRVVVKAATLADQAKEPTTIEVLGTVTQRDWLDTEVRNTLSAKTTVKVVDEPAAKPELVISPVPSVK